MKSKSMIDISAIHQDVKELLGNDKSGHGIDHVDRVLKLAMAFAENERADREVVTLATLLHDVDDYKIFGENGQVQVVLLERTESLIKLHLDVLTILEDGGLALNDPQFARDGLRPHATVQKHARLNKGDKVLFTALGIIDMFPNEDPSMRKVLKTIKID